MAGTVTVAHSDERGEIREIVATCTADAANGSFPATALPAFEGRILSLRTNPGATAPTDNYDITLIDGDGLDRLQSLGLNRDTANSEEVPVFFASSDEHPPVALDDTLTLTIANNSVNSATLVVTIIYAPGV